MGTLYIDRKELFVKLDGQAIAFYSNNVREGVVPINPLKRVVIVGNVLLETSVLNRLAQEGISVLFLSGKRLNYRGILHGRLHNNGLLRVRQYEKSLLSLFTKEIAVYIVRKKLTSQRQLLIDAAERRHDLRFPLTTAIGILTQVIETIDAKIPEMDTLRGLEGGAASAYFSAYTTMFPESLNFTKRNKRPPQDPVNAMLSLCYTLLHFEMVREIEVIGLDPTIGFYHQFEYGRESLACDLIEPYRPLVDRFIWDFFRERIFTVRDFAMDDEKPGCYLKKTARQRFYQLYEEWAQKMRPLWIEDVRTLARRITDGQEPVYQSDQ